MPNEKRVPPPSSPSTPQKYRKLAFAVSPVKLAPTQRNLFPNQSVPIQYRETTFTRLSWGNFVVGGKVPSTYRALITHLSEALGAKNLSTRLLNELKTGEDCFQDVDPDIKTCAHKLICIILVAEFLRASINPVSAVANLEAFLTATEKSSSFWQHYSRRTSFSGKGGSMRSQSYRTDKPVTTANRQQLHDALTDIYAAAAHANLSPEEYVRVTLQEICQGAGQHLLVNGLPMSSIIQQYCFSNTDKENKDNMDCDSSPASPDEYGSVNPPGYSLHPIT